MGRQCPRVAVLFDRLGPYHRARLDAAGREMDVTAVEVADESATYAWREVQSAPTFRRTTLFSDADSTAISAGEKERAIHAELNDIDPDAVAIPGWSYPRALAALRWCTYNRTPAVVMAASTAGDFERRWWKEAIKRRVVAHFGAGLAGGMRHRSYLQELGLPEERIFLGYDVVDNDHFSTGAQHSRENAPDVRKEHSLPESYFLGVCRFVPKKNLRRLVEAYAEYRTEHGADSAWHLVLLGEGPERTAIEEATAEAGVREAVHLPGFKTYEDLPLYYGLAGAFVHASTREQWGLVVNEAMASGLPVLVSERCGCTPDLVQSGRNGYTFDPYHPSELARLMSRVAHGSVDVEAMGAASRDIIADWNPERFARSLRKAVEAALEDGPQSRSLFDRLLMKALMYR